MRLKPRSPGLAGLRRAWRRLLRHQGGVALTEFALALPLLSLLGMTTLELSNYAVTSLRISQAATHIADNAARVGDSDQLTAQRIYEGDIEDLFVGVRIQAGREIGLYQNGRVILSSLERNTDGGQWIHWQRCMGTKNVASRYGPEGTGASGTGLVGMGPAGREIQAGTNEAVMFVEIAYDYQPIIDNAIVAPFLPARTIHSTAAFIVRGSRDLADIYQRATPSTEWTCDRFETV